MNMWNNQKNRIFRVAFCVFMGLWLVCAQAQTSHRIIAYNVENLFDCEDDSLTRDEGYLPNSMRGWHYKRYQNKLMAISKVVTAISGWDVPMLVGLCEVENRRCLEDLCVRGPLRTFALEIAHYESPDRRGIDVALLYNPRVFTMLHSEAIPVGLKASPRLYTRDILYVKGVVEERDTLHVYLCHFPSRWSGKKETEHLRAEAASVLREHADSVSHSCSRALIVMMGDFNDNPSDKSMCQVLGALSSEQRKDSVALCNLMGPLSERNKGTHYYQGQWSCYDQMIVSPALLDKHSGLQVVGGEAHIFDADFLLKYDEQYLQQRPLRTYNGMTYWGGFSDHLPVYIDLEVKQ